MKAISKTILFTMFAAASSFAMAEQNSDQVIQRHKEAKPVLKALLEEGKVLSVGPAGATGKSGVMQRSKYDGRPQTFEIKIRTPDDVIHIVEFRGLPFGLNNV
ncbi:co-regulatory protein PtrA N-terminal domain-containing protein [Stutzerimonas stutzeri]|uniref:co-regulatory protein PtrA N-terminal domain-containing protein n=1 Tax=Stutzerimonas stutzeri TaxID=316 RepID=UPI003D05C1E3